MRGQLSATFRLDTTAETIDGKFDKADTPEANASTERRAIESEEWARVTSRATANCFHEQFLADACFAIDDDVYICFGDPACQGHETYDLGIFDDDRVRIYVRR